MKFTIELQTKQELLDIEINHHDSAINYSIISIVQQQERGHEDRMLNSAEKLVFVCSLQFVTC